MWRSVWPSVQGQGCNLFLCLLPWVQGNDAEVWGFTTMPDKTLRNVRAYCLIERRPRGELMQMINICQLVVTASMLPPLLEPRQRAVSRLPKQRPSMEGSEPRAGFKLSACHVLAQWSWALSSVYQSVYKNSGTDFTGQLWGLNK